MKNTQLSFHLWKQYYANVYNLPLEVVESNTYQDWLNGNIKTDLDALLDWRLRLKQLKQRPLYRHDKAKLNIEIQAVDAILSLLYSREQPTDNQLT